MADHSVEVELFYDGDWQAAPAYTRDGINLSRGAPGEGQEAPPSAATLTLDNRDGNANPRNPTGALYGLAGRNTPMRVSADGSVRSTTEAASWGPQRAIKGDAWTAVQGGGILRRIQQGKTPLKAPLDRAIRFQGPQAYWPLNDGENSTLLASGLPDGTAMTVQQSMRLAHLAGPAGTVGSFPNLVSEEYETVSGDNEGSYVGWATATVPPLDTAGWAVEGIFYIDRISPNQSMSASSAVLWDVTGGVGTEGWSISLSGGSSGNCDIIIAGGGGGSFSEAGVSLAPGWHYFRFTADQVGANVTLTLFVDGVLEETDTVNSVTLGRPTNLRYGNPNAGDFAVFNVRTASIGMLAFSNLDDSTDNTDASTGYSGELAGVRFLRLADEEGIAAQVVGGSGDTQSMGVQPIDTFVNLLRECVRTDDGLLYEARTALTLTMRTGRDRYNQDPALTLDFAAEGVGVPLAPVLDDQNTRNDVKAVRRNGSSAQAVKTTGPLNVSDPIDDPEGVGRYDTQVDVNTATDDTLYSHAYWHMAKGTVDEARYPQVVVDLDAASTLITVVNAVQIGDRITITNLPTDWQQGDASLLVLGIKESFPGGAGDYRRLVTLVTIPASPYEIGIVGANDGSTDLRGQAVDTDNSTLALGITAVATSLSVASTGGVLWTTDSDDWNPAQNGGGLYIVIGGEDMRVTAISGASSPQTFTVERAANGVVKSHLAGAPVHVRQPVRAGL